MRSCARLDAAGVELVCLAGYMRIVGDVLLGAYGGRIVNIHPSLLPAFRGAHAIEQALEYGVKVFGVTIHYVDADARRRTDHRPAGRSDTTATTSGSWKPGFMRWNIRLYIETINKLIKGIITICVH